MRGSRWPAVLIALSVFCLLGSALVAGCGGGGGPIGPPANGGGGGGGGGGNGTLTLTLDPSINEDEGTVFVTSITTAELLSPSGGVVQTGTVSGTSATFNTASVASGDYFIRLNGLADPLVPTRIDSGTQTVTQTVGNKLINSFIGPSSSPTYHIKVYSKAQGEQAVVKYSDGTLAPPERYIYAIVSYRTTPQRLEIRVLGTAALLTSFTPSSSVHPGAGNAPFTTWILSEQNHGVVYNGNDAACSPCHGSLDTHVASHASIGVSNGWCYRCHYGKGGDGNGFVDPTQ